MIKTCKSVPASGAPLLSCATLACVLLAFLPGDAWAQRGGRGGGPPHGSAGPPEHRAVVPVNLLPNPYVTQRDFGTLPDGRSWGSVSAVNIDIDGIHVRAGDRCGTNECATSDVDPIVKLDPDGNVVQSFGAGELMWPHGMDVDAEGNVWIADARLANARELEANPDAASRGGAVIKFSGISSA